MRAFAAGRGFGAQLIFAAVAAAITAIAHPLLGMVVGYTNAMFALAGVLGLAYSLWMIGSQRRGLVSVALFWTALGSTVLVFGMPFSVWAIALTGLVWITRCIYLHRTAIGAALDFALSSVALGAAGWAAIQTGSLGWTIWTFFLVSALSTLIKLAEPGAAKRQGKVATPAGSAASVRQDFERAHQCAAVAIEKLARVSEGTP